MRRQRVSQILAQLTDSGDQPEDARAPLPARLCLACVPAVQVTGAGLGLMTAEGPSGAIVAATDAIARRMEELQFSLGEGPCVDAARSGRAVLQSDLLGAATYRWPGFAAAALTIGVRAVFSFPLRVGAIRIGVLDLYRDTPGYLTETQVAEALAFTDAAMLVMLHLQDSAPEGQVHPALSGPLDGGAKIHQATGMVSVQLGISLGDALLRLRAHAYAQERPVADVAADVVDRRLRFDDGETGHSAEAPQ